MRLLQRVASLYGRGDLRGAESLCAQLLQIQPDQPDALHILGLIAWSHGNYPHAIKLIRQAVDGNPTAPHFHNSLGVVLRSSGNPGAAVTAFRLAIELEANYPEAIANLGNALRDSGHLEDAEKELRRLSELAPNYAEGYSSLAMVLSRRGRTAEAVDACRTAVLLNPGQAELHNNLGVALEAAGGLDEGVAAYRRAIALTPSYADAHANLGIALHRSGRFEEAMAALQIAAAFRPQDARIWLSICATLLALDRSDEAFDVCCKALALDPSLPELHNNLGMLLKEKGRLADAIAAYQTAIGLQSDYAEAHNNLGVALNAALRFSEALASYDRALVLKPDYADASWNKGMLHLLLGEFELGWRGYECGVGMMRGRGNPRRGEFPEWRGEALAEKTILIWSEQGVGDQIMFASLLPDLLERGAACVVEADARLEPLLSRSFDGLAFIRRSETVSSSIRRLAIDFQSPFGSLCRWLRPDLAGFPRRAGFLKADPVRVDALRRRYRARCGERPIVGISWRGGTGQVARLRSIPLAQWSPILAQRNVAFINLQYGDCLADLAAVRRDVGIEVFHDDTVDPLESLDDFAAQTAAMDLVISIDNSTVHMAGALDVPVWTLLPAVPDWRWMLGRSDSPWYSSVRLFRQPAAGAWTPVIDSVARELGRAFGAADSDASP